MKDRDAPRCLFCLTGQRIHLEFNVDGGIWWSSLGDVDCSQTSCVFFFPREAAGRLTEVPKPGCLPPLAITRLIAAVSIPAG